MLLEQVLVEGTLESQLAQRQVLKPNASSDNAMYHLLQFTLKPAAALQMGAQ